MRLNFSGDTLDYTDSGGLKGSDFLGVVGHKSDPGDTECVENLGGKLVGAAVGGEAELDVGFDSVEAVVLELVSTKFGHEANAATFLLLIEEDSGAFRGNALECELQLETAIAADGAEDVSCQALGVDADNGSWGGRSCVYVPQD
jgi:hypothetical protein